MSSSAPSPSAHVGDSARGERYDALRHRVVERLLRLLTTTLRFLGRHRKRRAVPGDRGWAILLTLRYESTNPAMAFVAPLATCGAVRSIEVVVIGNFPDIAGVRVTRPPAWLVAVCGTAAARLFVLAWRAIVTRPDLVGGFHLLFNGFGAALVAAALGCRSLYFCVGGPTEVLDGGAHGENRFLGRVRRPSKDLERCLLEVVAHFDIVATMGTSAAGFFRARGVERCIVFPGAIDSARFSPGEGGRDLDAVLVARLTPVKRPQLFVRSIAEVVRTHPSTRAAVIGDGPLRGECEALARELGLTDEVHFAGHQHDVAHWLRRARAFVLPSRSEGLALAMLEAMACGAVPVVSDVGDLGDVVVHGENGFLLRDPTPDTIAAAVLQVVRDARLRERMSMAAVQTARRYDLEAARQRWRRILGGRDIDLSEPARLVATPANGASLGKMWR